MLFYGAVCEFCACVSAGCDYPLFFSDSLKLVREDNRLSEVPFVLFSALISEEMKRKGESLGASGQVSKPEINQLIDLLDTLTFGEPLHDTVEEN